MAFTVDRIEQPFPDGTPWHVRDLGTLSPPLWVKAHNGFHEFPVRSLKRFAGFTTELSFWSKGRRAHKYTKWREQPSTHTNSHTIYQGRTTWARGAASAGGNGGARRFLNC